MRTRATNASTSARTSSSVISGTSGCSGASTQNVIPKLVSGRVVNTRKLLAGRIALRVAHVHLELGAFGPTDPVALHRDDSLGPVEMVEVVEQLLRVRR